MITTRLRIKELLRERRWTTKVLAEKTGISESYLTHIKNGTRRWNEDALKKLADAFDLAPYEILESGSLCLPDPSKTVQFPEDLKNQLAQLSLKLKLIPVVGQIPSQPSPTNNQIIQQTTGYKDQFVSVIDLDDDAAFCLKLEDNSLAPAFVRDDLLIISPAAWTTSGNIVAVEYGTDNPTKAIVQVNFMDELIVLESINHKKAPIALVRGKDQIRIIGKVMYRYQKTS
jgi:SOS-response transcriptional repressor LexA